VILAEQYRTLEPRACAPGQKTASRIFFETAPKSRLEKLPQVAELHQEKLTRFGQTCTRPSSTAEERDATGNVTKRFFGAGEQIGGVNYYYTTDHLGSVREMTDATGAVRARYEYDPYGRQTKIGGDLEADFGFTGFYRHQASGLNLTLFRAYDAELGRWTTRDPIAEEGGLNLYAYVMGDPINLVDPLGLRWVDVYVWTRKGTSPGHMMLTEHNSTTVILSQFPHGPFEDVTRGNGPNTMFTYGQTYKAEGRDEAARYEVFVDNDAAFDAAADAERAKKEWDWNPDSTQTQCSVAAWNPIAAGGVNGRNLPPISRLSWPGNIGDRLRNMIPQSGGKIKQVWPRH
jgi:RHS repeat-associated protein